MCAAASRAEVGARDKLVLVQALVMVAVKAPQSSLQTGNVRLGYSRIVLLHWLARSPSPVWQEAGFYITAWTDSESLNTNAQRLCACRQHSHRLY